MVTFHEIGKKILLVELKLTVLICTLGNGLIVRNVSSSSQFVYFNFFGMISSNSFFCLDLCHRCFECSIKNQHQSPLSYEPFKLSIVEKNWSKLLTVICKFAPDLYLCLQLILRYLNSSYYKRESMTPSRIFKFNIWKHFTSLL